MQEANPSVDFDKLQTGQVIKVPAQSNVSHYPKDGPADIQDLTAAQAKGAKQAYDTAYRQSLEREKPLLMTKVNAGENTLADVAKTIRRVQKGYGSGEPGHQVRCRTQPNQIVMLPLSLARERAKEAGDQAMAQWLRANVRPSGQ